MGRYQSLMQGGRKLLVYVPHSYTEGERRYPVAYVQDGGELFEQCINYIDMLNREGKLPEVVLVGVATSNRNLEYTPWEAQPLLSGKPGFGGGGRAYVDELADVIKPYVDGLYRTKPEAEHTAIIGGSLGGLISLLAGMWRSETFGRVGMLSASMWFEGMLDYIAQADAPAEASRFYMSVGSQEGIYKDGIQRHMVINTIKTHRMLAEKGVGADRLKLDIDPSGTHDDLFMTGRFAHALRWLLGEEQSASDKGDRLQAAASTLSRYSVPGTETFTMRSRYNGAGYRIMVSIPVKPAPAEGYPVLYALDGNAYFGSMAEAMRMQSRHPLGLAPGIIVGIGYDSEAEEPFVADRRFYDYTTQSTPNFARPDGTPWPTTGGAEFFLAFIEEELKPEIERRYPIDRSRQGLFGHSLGGYFTLYALMHRPGTFRTYVAGSPSIWWNEQELLIRLPAFISQLVKYPIEADVLIGIGGDEKPSMLDDARSLYTQLRPFDGYGLRASYACWEDEGHVSVIYPLISRMYRMLFSKGRETLCI
ncbi:hypothetical protein DFQ01_12278 [Paenibacillus cellulosilyticus]|uniref:Alpha/beta superfamily hydrolase n=1 Tax=Paenibacillus cellulosilyticus TaxID=375489 RepID=A0A2V2YNP6_9BACL|nr:alpha/beta hydrolase-fold protein [Paenibacillus cellulosilyticus]PWV97347.1 hypothetical protein DFQ01_12278 [Paenibacillus cellulosilyticus]QKS47456.1 alpha/beta hydrolase [Paenibacillus cellulosilyticus]